MVFQAVTGAIRANIASQVNQTVSGLSKDVKSNPWLNPDANNSSVGTSSNKGFSSPILTYPLDVDSDSQQGHYILFYIEERTKAKLKTNKKQYRPNMIDMMEGDPSIQDTQYDFKKTSRNFYLQHYPHAVTKATIALYMPPSVQVSYQTKYGEQQIGLLAEFGEKIINRLAKGGQTLNVMRDLLHTGSKGLKQGGTQALYNTIDAVAPGAKALWELNNGKIITPHMEMMFEGVGRRNFSYSFDFTPKDEQEAKNIENIIYHFKKYMMPKYDNPSNRREMHIPGTFKIQYMYQGDHNHFLNKISHCFLSQVDVDYGGDRYTAHKSTTGRYGSGAPPQKSKITLQFNEIELLRQEDIEQGY